MPDTFQIYQSELTGPELDEALQTSRWCSSRWPALPKARRQPAGARPTPHRPPKRPRPTAPSYSKTSRPSRILPKTWTPCRARRKTR